MFRQVRCNVEPSIDTSLPMTSSVWKEFGAWIKGKRDKANLSQDGAARRADIDRQQWYRIENGLSGTRRDTVIRMARGVSADPNEALTYAGFAPIPQRSGPPQTLEELIEIAESLGIQNLQFFDHDKLRSATPEQLQEVLEAIEVAMSVTLARQMRTLTRNDDLRTNG